MEAYSVSFKPLISIGILRNIYLEVAKLKKQRLSYNNGYEIMEMENK